MSKSEKEPLKQGPLPSGFLYSNLDILAVTGKDKNTGEDKIARICSDIQFIGTACNPDGTGHSIIIRIGIPS